MSNSVTIKWYAATMDCVKPHELATFYASLMGWVIAYEDEEYTCIAVPGTCQGAYPILTFQRSADYRPPVWPDEPERQQQMAHLDFAVDDVPSAVCTAMRLGAKEASQQFSDGWRVMLDPEGHPFCLVAMKSLMKSGGFALR